MKTRITTDLRKLNVEKMHLLIKKLEELGVYKNGIIDCPIEMDDEVLKILDEYCI